MAYSILLSGESTVAVAEAILVRRLTPPVVPVFFGAGLERIADMQALRKRLANLAAFAQTRFHATCPATGMHGDQANVAPYRARAQIVVLSIL
jgi:hypothetical protein